jgi:hypothetical protein
MSAKARATWDVGNLAVAPRADVPPPAPPSWAEELVASSSDEFALTTVRIGDAIAMGAAELEAQVAEAYASLAATLRESPAGRPVRLWNHIPAINARMDDRRDRYMVFNAGRYRAFEEWYGGTGAFDRDVATASGVGHDGRDLVVHCLSSRAPGLAVDNPRQIAPHRYSDRYGPLPPCFARATVLRDRGLILVGGTASIRGEESVHSASLPLQLRETLTNLASVVGAGHAAPGASTGGTRDEARWLGLYREVRVYYPRAEHATVLHRAVREVVAPACRVEMMRADLCRMELLVEIEGVAGLES